MRDEEVGHDGVEGLVVDREPVGVALAELDARVELPGELDHDGRQVDAECGRAACDRTCGHLPGTGRHVEHT